MKGLLQILFKNYNDFLIPHEIINGKKVLILNSVHAFYTTDAKYYDNCLKITYNFDKKEFTIRSQNMNRAKLNMPDLEKFLLNEINKYELPEEENITINNLSARVIEYYFPSIKEVNSNIKTLNSLVKKDKKILTEMGVYKTALLFIQQKINYEINSIPTAVNVSEISKYKMTGSVIKDIGNFIKNENIKTCTIHETDGEYWVDITLEKT